MHRQARLDLPLGHDSLSPQRIEPLTESAHLSSSMARATRAVVLVDRRFSGRSLLIDDLSMTRIERDCSELVFNGDFSEDTTQFFYVTKTMGHWVSFQARATTYSNTPDVGTLVLRSLNGS